MKNCSPERPTMKMLGGLSVCADRFDTHFNATAAYGYLNPALGYTWFGNQPQQPGAGFWGHKVGYNVLFGDNHVTWNADPGQWYMWEWNVLPMSAIAPGWGGQAGNTGWGRAGTNDTVGSNPFITQWPGGGLGYGAGIFTLFDDVANQESTSGFYMGQWVSNYGSPPGAMNPGNWD